MGIDALHEPSGSGPLEDHLGNECRVRLPRRILLKGHAPLRGCRAHARISNTTTLGS